MVKGVRQAANNCTKYEHAKMAHEIKEEYNLSKIIKLCSNENPYGPFPSIRQIMADEVDKINIYPEKNYAKLQQLLAQKYRVPYDYIALGHGAGNVLEVMSKTMLDEGDEVIIPKVTYNIYREVSTIMGANIVYTHMNKDYTIDLQSIKNSITDKTK